MTELPELEGRLSVEDFTEVTRVLKRTREETLQTCDELYQKKLGEIDEAHQHYLTDHAGDDQGHAGFDVTSSMKLFDE
jgi:hypothetical protein